MASLTLLQLRTAVRQRADMVNSQFVTDAELTSYINQSYQELYDLLRQKFGDDYFVAPEVTITTTGTNDLYALPDGTNFSAAPAFQNLLGVDLLLSNQADSAVTIKPFMFIERNRYAVPNFQSFYGVTNLRYRLRGNNIWFTPIPSAGQSIRLFYVPQLVALSADGDLADNLGGWLEYVICDAAIKCMQKEESDVSVLGAQKLMLITRIEAAAETRDPGSPQIVSDTIYNNSSWPTGNGSGMGGFF